MESDRRFFIEGLFVILLSLGIVFGFMWLNRAGERDDVVYHIRFNESVSGLAVGEPVRYLGVAVGTVRRMSIDPADPGQVLVEVALRKDAPVKTDTRAILKIKGITGACFIELGGGSAEAEALVSVTGEGQIPEIISEKAALTTFLEELPRVVAKFSSLEDQAKKVVTDIGEVTEKVKENPSLLLRRPKDKKGADKGTGEKRGRGD